MSLFGVTRARTHTHTCVSAHVRTLIRVHTHTHSRMRAHAHARTHIQVHARTYIQVHTLHTTQQVHIPNTTHAYNAHTYTHTHTHTHTYTHPPHPPATPHTHTTALLKRKKKKKKSSCTTLNSTVPLIDLSGMLLLENVVDAEMCARRAALCGFCPQLPHGAGLGPREGATHVAACVRALRRCCRWKGR